VKPNIYGKKTKYKGIVFRSKVESRVAKKFNEYGIVWQYEPKRFQLSNCTYLPDFFLPELDTWVEVKYAEDSPKLEQLIKEKKIKGVLIQNTDLGLSEEFFVLRLKGQY